MPEQIVKILSSVKNDRWREKLQKIKQGIDAYEKWRSGQSSYSPEQIVEQHLYPILPKYWDVFHTHNSYRKQQGLLPSNSSYDVGIFLVGFSSLPIVLSLAEIQPCERIYFLGSSGTEGSYHIVVEIQDRVKKMLDADCNFDRLISLVDSACLIEIDRPSDPVETFKQIKNIINSVGSDKTIALDLTGGKKTMIGGGFTAGSILSITDSIHMFYIDSLEYDRHRGAPVPGTEFLSRLENPYDVYNVQTGQEAEALFSKHNYEAAAKLWDSVHKGLKTHAKRYSLESIRDTVLQNRDMANCYHFWDSLDYASAKSNKGKFKPEYDKRHYVGSINILDILSLVTNKQALFTSEKRVIHYAVDRYQNGIRRKESGKLDDAIVRFAQVVEILCNYQIYRVADAGKLLRYAPNKAIVGADDCIEKRWSISNLVSFLFGKTTYKYRRGSYSIDRSCSLLLAISDYNGTVTEVDDIIDLIDYRNKVIHFDGRMDWQVAGEKAENLQSLANEFLVSFSRSYCCTNSLNFGELLELHAFRQ